MDDDDDLTKSNSVVFNTFIFMQVCCPLLSLSCIGVNQTCIVLYSLIYISFLDVLTLSSLQLIKDCGSVIYDIWEEGDCRLNESCGVHL